MPHSNRIQSSDNESETQENETQSQVEQETTTTMMQLSNFFGCMTKGFVYNALLLVTYNLYKFNSCANSPESCATLLDDMKYVHDISLVTSVGTGLSLYFLSKYGESISERFSPVFNNQEEPQQPVRNNTFH